MCKIQFCLTCYDMMCIIAEQNLSYPPPPSALYMAWTQPCTQHVWCLSCFRSVPRVLCPARRVLIRRGVFYHLFELTTTDKMVGTPLLKSRAARALNLHSLLLLYLQSFTCFSERFSCEFVHFRPTTHYRLHIICPYQTPSHPSPSMK